MLLKDAYLKFQLIMGKNTLTVGFILFISLSLFAQANKSIDSLELKYSAGDFEVQDKLMILKELSKNHPDPDVALNYSNKLIEEATNLDSLAYLYHGHLSRGNAFRLKGDLSLALEDYFLSAELAIDSRNNKQVGIINIVIADVYSIMENHTKAIQYYNNSIEILRQEKDSLNLASALLNAGDGYFNQGSLDTAIVYFSESAHIFKAIDYLTGSAYNRGNMGMVYAEQGKDGLATKNILAAIEILEKEKDYYPVAVYLTYMSNIYAKKDDWESAFHYAELSLDLAQKYGLKKQIGDANLLLSQLHERVGNLNKHIKYFKSHIVYKDSVKNISSVQQMASLRSDFEISQKQIEVDLLNEQQKNQQNIVIATAVALFLVGLLAFGLYRRYLFIKKTKFIIEKEKKHSEELLLNILPKETALELKKFGSVKAKKFESVTVLFTDFKDFTRFSEDLSPEELVESVDFYFSKFDEIIDKYGLEKIKTVGDSYMCVGGLPFPVENHAMKMIEAAKEIILFVEGALKNNIENKTRFEIRIGINSGPVVAGVVGTKKYAYDIWGDTVNVASRMETNSDPGRINISNNTYKLVRDVFECEYRGNVEVKNRGKMKMYFVNEMKV